MKLKHVDLDARCVYQDAREVKTKFSKTFITYFFPMGNEIRRIVNDWVLYLRQEKLWGNDAPLFPATQTVLGAANQFEAALCANIVETPSYPLISEQGGKDDSLCW